MKEVGDKFGAGELILPFVLQSAEVMKRAVAQLENYLDRIDGHTKGKVVIATVFGDVHDIGKSLVNTILTNNGYTVIDLGKQVPVDTIIEAAVENEADAIGLSALLVSTSKQMPTCIQELHQRGLEFPVLIGGAAINRDFGRRTLYPKGRESDEVYEPGVFYCKDAFQGLDTMDALVDEEARAALVERIRGEAKTAAREAGRRRRRPADHRRQRALGGRHRQPDPASRRSSACARSTSTSTRSSPTSTATCSSSCTGAAAGSRARPGASWSRATARRRASRPGWSGCGSEQDYLQPAGAARLLPGERRRQRAGRLRPRGPRARARAARLPAPAEARPDLPRRLLPAAGLGRTRRRRPAGRHRRPRGHRADRTAGVRRRVRRAALRPRPRRAVGRGPGRVAALAGPRRARDPGRPGAPLLVGLPGLPGPVRAREGLAPARPRGDRDDPLGRLRRDARAVDGGDRRPPPAGGLLRDEVRLHPRGQGARRVDRRHRAGRRAAAGVRSGATAPERATRSRSPPTPSAAEPPRTASAG